jgi:hypothetical protein
MSWGLAARARARPRTSGLPDVVSPLPRFTTGDRVTFIPGRTKKDGNVRRGVYTVVRALPIAAQGRQYRIKSDLDEHERVVDEAQLRPEAQGRMPL